MRTRSGLRSTAFGTCVVLAIASLALPADPVYDAWAWLLWGRELTGSGLDLDLGPSWKPLAVGITAVLALAGDAAPQLWLVLVRAAWLIALVLAARLAYVLSDGHDRRERIAAAAFASLSLLLLLDPVTSWLRQGAAGMSEPLLVALVLCAVRAGIDGRMRVALVAGALAALLRPETWPLLAAYGLWCWRRERSPRGLMVALAITIPVLWLGPELLTAGDALGGAERAQRGDQGPLRAIAEVAQRALELPLLAAWPLALLAAAAARRARVLLAGALAWIAVVALMTAAGGFVGLPRFMAPAAAVVGVLGGVGLARLLAIARQAWHSRASRSAVPALALAALLVALVSQVPTRADEELRSEVELIGRIERSHDRLIELVRAVGRHRLLRCGKLATSDTLVRTALAWELDVPLSGVVHFGRPPRESGAFIVGPLAPLTLKRSLAQGADLLGERGGWRAYSLDCPATAGSSAPSSGRPPSAGVTGARR